ncbi:LacI family DNA-binding transcriptional regulator [Winogradskya consettensis]|uniref:HTH-type transcriptional regulator MalR n=1 Tax=Winogradskya consettensis TaxID=113560 RepID=A0A919SEW1_9ACTN|nr:HTH-type transcriptional regulator MalR [Actinoplanes consettensis]
MRARLSDIARQAEVSEATVSRVLNDRPGVSADTRQAVLTALDVLGYERPERLRKRSAGLVGLVVPELENPIFPAFAQTIESALSQSGFTPVLCTQTPGGVTEDEYVEMLLDRQVSGIVFVSGLHADTTADHDRYRRLVDRPLPIVLINGYADGLDAPFISCDDRLAGELAVNHLVALGHERIGFVSGPHRFLNVQRKLEGYRTAMRRELGVRDKELDDLVALTLFGVEGGEVAAGQLIARGATAIVCGSDLMALGAIRAARRRGLSVPRDISVVGFDDSPLIAFTDPPLTTLRQPVAAMGNAAIRQLVDEINGHGAPRSEYVFSPELVVRGSTAINKAGRTTPKPGRTTDTATPDPEPAKRPAGNPAHDAEPGRRPTESATHDTESARHPTENPVHDLDPATRPVENAAYDAEPSGRTTESAGRGTESVASFIA